MGVPARSPSSFQRGSVQFIFGKTGVLCNFSGGVFQANTLCFQCQDLCHAILQSDGGFLLRFRSGQHQNKFAFR